MKKIKTKHLGEVNIDETKIINFPKGIPSFEEYKKFVLIPLEDISFIILQSIENEDVSFIIIPPVLIHNNYNIEIDDREIEELKIENLDEIQTYSMVVIPEDTSKMSANLKAPIIINEKKLLGKQVVLKTDQYPIRYYFMQQG